MIQEYQIAELIQNQLNSLDTNGDGIPNIVDAFGDNKQFKISSFVSNYESEQLAVEDNEVYIEELINGILYKESSDEFLSVQDMKTISVDYRLEIPVQVLELQKAKHIVNLWAESLTGKVFTIDGWKFTMITEFANENESQIDEVGQSTVITINISCDFNKYGLIGEDVQWTILYGNAISRVYPASVELVKKNNSQAFPLLSDTDITNEVKYMNTYASRALEMTFPVSENIIIKQLYKDIVKENYDNTYTIRQLDDILGEEVSKDYLLVDGSITYELGNLVVMTCIFGLKADI